MVTTPDSGSTSRTTPTSGIRLGGRLRASAGARPRRRRGRLRAAARARDEGEAEGEMPEDGDRRGDSWDHRRPRTTRGVRQGWRGRGRGSEGHQKGKESSRGLAESSVRKPASRSTTISVRASPLLGGGGPGVARARVGRQEVPGAGDLDPAPVDGLEPGGGHGRRRRPGPVATRSGKWASPMLVSISPGVVARVVVEIVAVAVGGDLVPVAEEEVDRRRPGAARGGPISGRCRRAR